MIIVKQNKCRQAWNH